LRNPIGARKEFERNAREASDVVDVIVPVLDEAEALPFVLGRMPIGYTPIVVDNGSTDGSGEIGRAMGALVVTEPRRGFGAACFAGLAAASSDVVAFMDGDGSLDPADLPDVVEPVDVGAADLVLGARASVAGAWPMHARLGNRAIAWEVRRRTGLALHDLGPMRAARRRSLLELGIVDRRFGWPLEMVVRAASAGWRIREVEVPYRARTGRSKVTGTIRGTARTVLDMTRVLR
jgi:glycosyltransferase involved in cell wall biosynthesis